MLFRTSQTLPCEVEGTVLGRLSPAVLPPPPPPHLRKLGGEAGGGGVPGHGHWATRRGGLLGGGGNYIRYRSHNFFAKKCYRRPSWR